MPRLFENEADARRRLRQLGLWYGGFLIAQLLLLPALILSLAQSVGAPVEWRWLPWLALALLPPCLGVTWWQQRRHWQLDGPLILSAMGARPLQPREISEQRFANCSEEIAIAALLPPARLFVLEDVSINAVVAGRSPEQACMALSRGALERLDRAQLTALVAYGYSQISDGDMQLNLQLGACLNGGFWWYSLPRRWFTRLWHESRGVGGLTLRRDIQLAVAPALFAAMVIVPVSFGIDVSTVLQLTLAGCLSWLVMGVLGFAAGRWLQKICHQQSVFQADAEVVRYTRDDRALLGLLQAAAGIVGTRIDQAIPEWGHLYFAEACGREWLSSHPTLLQRIQRWDPGASAQDLQRLRERTAPGRTATATPSPPQTPVAGDFAVPAAWLAALDPALVARIRQAPVAAYAALLFATEPARQRPQVLALRQQWPQVADDALPLALALAPLDVQPRLAAALIALAELQSAPTDTRGRISGVLTELTRLNAPVGVWAYCLMSLLRSRWLPAAAAAPRLRLEQLPQAAGLIALVAELTHAGADAEPAFERARALLPWPARFHPSPDWPARLTTLRVAIGRLERADAARLLQAVILASGPEPTAAWALRVLVADALAMPPDLWADVVATAGPLAVAAAPLP